MKSNRNYFVTTVILVASILWLSLIPSFSFAGIPKVQEFTSEDGINYWAIEDNYLPIISIRIDFKNSGYAYDPENRQGLANMAARLMTEGAGGMSGIEFMTKIEELAINIGFSTDADNFYISMTCLKENINKAIELLSLAINSPDFTNDAIERTRENLLVAIARQNEDPAQLASKTFMEKYFAGHPYARNELGNEEGIKKITKNDLVKFVQEHFARSNMLIGVTGSITHKEISPLFDKYLANLPKNMVDTRTIPEFTPNVKIGQIIRIEKPVPQSVVIFGFPGPKRNDTDFYPTYIANHILGGGGFESRLMHEVREKKGLAYTVYTALQTYDKAGIIYGYVATKNSSIDESIQIITQEINKIHKKGIDKQEIVDAKDYLIGSFPLRMTQNSALASFITAMQNENLGIDFLDKRNNYITNTTIGNCNIAAAKYMDIDKMLTIVVGGK